MTRKKLVAGFLSVTMVVSMSVPAWASVEEVSAHPNITALSTDTFELADQARYTEKVDKGTTQTLSFAVCGASDTWQKGYLTAEEANEDNLKWTFVDGSVTGLSVTWEAVDLGDGYCSLATVEVPADVSSGLAVVEAYYADNPKSYCDFSILINGDGTEEVSDITNIFYNVTGENEVSLGQTTCASVAASNFYGNSNYPSVLDCPMALMLTEKSVISNYEIVDNYGTYTLKSFAFSDGTKVDTDFSDWSSPGWQYRVYDANGKIKPLSAKVSGDDFSLASGDTVVWKYGTYSGTSFADTL